LAFAADLLAADQVANGMVPPGPEDAELTAELTHAATNGELRLLFQPEVDLWTRRIVAAECLLRWEHPRLGLLEPARFIQLAERAGAMDTLGTWVVDTAIAQLATWSGASVAAGLSLRVNISPSQFAHRDVAGLVGAALARHHVPGRRLCVEITETAPLPPLDLAARTIEALHQVGVATAIDDWGTGYSRLSQLRVLPVDAVKLDRSFVTDLHVDPRAAAIVRGLIGLAASLDLTVVAEGVETEAEAAALLTYGCSRAQGHLFGAAMSADALESRLSEAAAARPLT
jgi:EAL domain-containing protein (putative c-di-GMP-specific phosphodiesterase class I)